jgi:nucleotide-binding universal stress UspA family protein
MNTKRILLPIDVRRCPLEVFETANGFAKSPHSSLSLLHVVNLNIAPPDYRIYEELSHEAQSYLLRLADRYVHPLVRRQVHIRIGNTVDQILAQAKAENTDLILLPTYCPSHWHRLCAFWRPAATPLVSRLADKLIRKATCPVFLVQAKSRFNCEAAWDRVENEAQNCTTVASSLVFQSH